MLCSETSLHFLFFFFFNVLQVIMINSGTIMRAGLKQIQHIVTRSAGIFLYLSLSDDVFQSDKAAPDSLLLLLFELNLDMSYHGHQGNNALVMFQAFLARL